MTREEAICCLSVHSSTNGSGLCTDEQHYEAKQLAIKALEQDPTGHWEWLTEDKYRCSNCNSETRVDECMNVPMYDFCPFCGAKMAESGDTDETTNA